jgi:hypothetical protein
MDSKIQKIRERCSIAWIWKLMGLPGEPARDCRSPFREDKKPSFSVYMAKDGERWFDHAEGVGGDIVDFYAKAKGVTIQQAIDQLGAMIGEATPPKASSYKVAKEVKEVEWPSDFRSPTIMEIESLGLLRGIPPGAFDLAERLGFLKVGTHKGELLWFLTDASKKGAEGKTFTGEPCLASGKKTIALTGTNKSWAYGLKSENELWDKMDKLILVEGLPDFFAALELVTDWPGNARPVAMLGASSSPGPETAQHFRGREVLIIGHNDDVGKNATKKWKDILREFGTTKRVIQPLPPEVKDLNEFIVQCPNDLSLLKGLEE